MEQVFEVWPSARPFVTRDLTVDLGGKGCLSFLYVRLLLT
jgi:hypothetical protein